MIIQLDSMIHEAKTIDDLKPLLLLIVKALNTMDDAKGKVKGDSIYFNGGIYLRGEDNAYHKISVGLSSGISALIIGPGTTNPAGE
jgi:hypothetical protein